MPRKLRNIELNRLAPEEFKSAAKTPLVLVLDDIRSMSNVGSIFRTADAYLIERIYLCGITARPPHKDIRKTALGADETVEWQGVSSTLSCIQELKQQGYYCLALEQAENSIRPETVEPQTKVALVLGNEVDGVSQEVVDACDEVVELPQYGSKHSLNVAVSTGICVYELCKRLRP